MKTTRYSCVLSCLCCLLAIEAVAEVVRASAKPPASTGDAGRTVKVPAKREEPANNMKVEFSAEQLEVIQRKALLYGVNPNLLRAVLGTELALQPNRPSLNLEEHTWAAEMSVRTLRHCLLNKRKLEWALQYYAAGSFDPLKVDDRARRFAELALKNFHQLEQVHATKTSAPKPQQQTKGTP